MGETEDYAGGVESTLLYAFHMQYQTLPAERTNLDLLLRGDRFDTPGGTGFRI